MEFAILQHHYFCFVGLLEKRCRFKKIAPGYPTELSKPMALRVSCFFLTPYTLKCSKTFLASTLHFGGLYGMYVVERERRYLEAGLFSSSGGLVVLVRSRV